MRTNNFVIRVYALITNSFNEVLISDEFERDTKMTKFPGGGLEFGEGPLECLIREIKEECNNQEIENINHFYTTDFYQEAFFYENHQLISIYYTAEFKDPIQFHISNKPYDFKKWEEGSQSFRWVKIKDLNEDEITFPIDKFVARKLKSDLLAY